MTPDTKDALARDLVMISWDISKIMAPWFGQHPNAPEVEQYALHFDETGYALEFKDGYNGLDQNVSTLARSGPDADMKERIAAILSVLPSAALPVAMRLRGRKAELHGIEMAGLMVTAGEATPDVVRRAVGQRMDVYEEIERMTGPSSRDKRRPWLVVSGARQPKQQDNGFQSAFVTDDGLHRTIVAAGADEATLKAIMLEEGAVFLKRVLEVDYGNLWRSPRVLDTDGTLVDASLDRIRRLQKEASYDPEAEDVPQWRSQFPDFGPMDVEIPEGFADVSWHNEACPCFASEEAQCFLFVDYADPAKREAGAEHRFLLVEGTPDREHGLQHDGDAVTLIAANSMTTIEEFVAFRKLSLEMTPRAVPAPGM